MEFCFWISVGTLLKSYVLLNSLHFDQSGILYHNQCYIWICKDWYYWSIPYLPVNYNQSVSNLDSLPFEIDQSQSLLQNVCAVWPITIFVTRWLCCMSDQSPSLLQDVCIVWPITIFVTKCLCCMSDQSPSLLQDVCVVWPITIFVTRCLCCLTNHKMFLLCMLKKQ